MDEFHNSSSSAGSFHQLTSPGSAVSDMPPVRPTRELSPKLTGTASTASNRNENDLKTARRRGSKNRKSGLASDPRLATPRLDDDLRQSVQLSEGIEQSSNEEEEAPKKAFPPDSPVYKTTPKPPTTRKSLEGMVIVTNELLPKTSWNASNLDRLSRDEAPKTPRRSPSHQKRRRRRSSRTPKNLLIQDQDEHGSPLGSDSKRPTTPRGHQHYRSVKEELVDIGVSVQISPKQQPRRKKSLRKVQAGSTRSDHTSSTLTEKVASMTLKHDDDRETDNLRRSERSNQSSSDGKLPSNSSDSTLVEQLAALPDDSPSSQRRKHKQKQRSKPPGSLASWRSMLQKSSSPRGSPSNSPTNRKTSKESVTSRKKVGGNTSATTNEASRPHRSGTRRQQFEQSSTEEEQSFEFTPPLAGLLSSAGPTTAASSRADKPQGLEDASMSKDVSSPLKTPRVSKAERLISSKTSKLLSDVIDVINGGGDEDGDSRATPSTASLSTMLSPYGSSHHESFNTSLSSFAIPSVSPRSHTGRGRSAIAGRGKAVFRKILSGRKKKSSNKSDNKEGDERGVSTSDIQTS